MKILKIKRLKFILIFMLVIFMQFIFIPTSKTYAFSNPATVPLGTVSNFAALAHTTITSPLAGTVLNNGNLGTDASCTGFPSPCLSPGKGVINNGAIHKADGVATIGQTDATAAVTNISGRSSNGTISGGLLDDLTLTQGVYVIPATTTNLTGNLTLSGDADSVFIFHATSTLITASGSRVLLTGGVQACHVFWEVDSSATFDGTTTMVGTVIASASIEFTGAAGGATLEGRAIAQTGAITFNNTTVNNSLCATPTSTPTPTSSSTSNPNSSSSSTNSSGSSSTICYDFPPTNNPDIFQIDRAGSKATLYFTPVNDYLSYYFVAYGLSPGDERFGVSFPAGLSTGVVNYTINDLNPNTTYYFKVRGGNGCAPGGWSNNLKSDSKSPLLPNTGMGPF